MASKIDGAILMGTGDPGKLKVAVWSCSGGLYTCASR